MHQGPSFAACWLFINMHLSILFAALESSNTLCYTIENHSLTPPILSFYLVILKNMVVPTWLIPNSVLSWINLSVSVLLEEEEDICELYSLVYNMYSQWVILMINYYFFKCWLFSSKWDFYFVVYSILFQKKWGLRVLFPTRNLQGPGCSNRMTLGAHMRYVEAKKGAGIFFKFEVHTYVSGVCRLGENDPKRVRSVFVVNETKTQTTRVVAAAATIRQRWISSVTSQHDRPNESSALSDRKTHGS